MEATKTENETIQRYLADLRIKGHTKGVQVSFFRGDKGISHSCNRCILSERLVIGRVLVYLTISIC